MKGEEELNSSAEIYQGGLFLPTLICLTQDLHLVVVLQRWAVASSFCSAPHHASAEDRMKLCLEGSGGGGKELMPLINYN